jgi:hypothetical protein
MSEMVERVARAIFEAEYTGGEGDEYRWERSQDAYRVQARAAIEAMREPTDAMRDAMRLANTNIAGGYGGPGGWEAAIDAALADREAAKRGEG